MQQRQGWVEWAPLGQTVVFRDERRPFQDWTLDDWVELELDSGSQQASEWRAE